MATSKKSVPFRRCLHFGTAVLSLSYILALSLMSNFLVIAFNQTPATKQIQFHNTTDVIRAVESKRCTVLQSDKVHDQFGGYDQVAFPPTIIPESRVDSIIKSLAQRSQNGRVCVVMLDYLSRKPYYDLLDDPRIRVIESNGDFTTQFSYFMNPALPKDIKDAIDYAFCAMPLQELYTYMVTKYARMELGGIHHTDKPGWTSLTIQKIPEVPIGLIIGSVMSLWILLNECWLYRKQN